MNKRLLFVSIGLIVGLVLTIARTGLTQNQQLVITADKQYEYAISLFEQKDFETAIVEFKRFVYFFPDHQKIDTADFYIAWGLFEQQKYHESAKAFNQIILKNNEDDLTSQAYFYQSQAFMKMGNTGYAKIVLHNYLKLTDVSHLKDKIYFNLAQIYLIDSINGDQGSLVLARKQIMNISVNGWKLYNIDQILELIQQAENTQQKNPIAAGIFAIIPGGGFLYSERYKDAFVAFLLNIGLMVATYQAWEDDNEALAGVIGFVETGFYTGNIYGSISSAHKYNLKQTTKILNRTFSIVPKIDQKNRIGLSLKYTF